MKIETASSRKIVKVLRRKTTVARKAFLLFIFAIKAPPLFARSKYKTCPSYSSDFPCPTYACSEQRMRAREHLSAVPGKKLSSPFLDVSTFLQSIPTRKKTSAKTAFLQSAPISTEALLFLLQNRAREWVQG